MTNATPRTRLLVLRQAIADLIGDLGPEIEICVSHAEDEHRHCADAVVIGGREQIDAAFLDRVSGIRLIACLGAGYDGVSFDAARARGVQVTNAAGTNADDVADLALAMLLGALCKLPELHAMVANGTWARGGYAPRRRSLYELTVGIVGMGAIGTAAAQRLRGFGFDLIWWGPRAKPDISVPRAASLLDLATRSDALLICCSASDSNRGMIDAGLLAALGPQGVLVNVSRGSLVDQGAVRDALKRGALAGAALDVFLSEPTTAEEWAGVPNVFLSPHAGGVAHGAIERQRMVLVDNLARLREGRPLLNVLK